MTVVRADGDADADGDAGAVMRSVGLDADAAGAGAAGFPPAGWLTNRETAERLGIGLDTLVTPWKYRDTLKAAARTVRKPGGGRCNLYPVELVERIVAEREAEKRAEVPDGFVDGDQAAEMLGIKRPNWNQWLSKGIVRIEHTSMPGVDGNGRRKLYTIADIERVREELKAAGKLLMGVDQLGPGKWLNINEAAAIAGVWVKTWDIWSKSGRVPAGTWVRGPGGQPTQMWREEVALNARVPETGDGTWVATNDAVAILRTTNKTLAVWVQEGRVPAGVQGKSNGSSAMLWRAEELRALRAEWDARPFPPEGWVDREGAMKRLGVSVNTLTLWIRHNRLPYSGKLVEGPNGVECRIFEISELDRAREQMKASEEAEAELPEGFVDFAGAAAFFDVHPVVINKWQRLGRLSRGEWRHTTGKARRRVFALAELEELKARMRAEAERPVAPEGFIELHAVSELLDVHYATISKWEKMGRLSGSRVAPIPGTSARTKIYPMAEIERLREWIRAEIENFPPAGWLEMGAAAERANVSVLVFKKWIVDGQIESGRYVSPPTMPARKIFSIEEIDRVVAERGRDHDFFLEDDGAGGLRVPSGYVGRADAAAMLGVTETAFVRWQTEGWIDFGRWARAPVGRQSPGRRAYPVERLAAILSAFEARGKPRIDENNPAVARVPVLSPDSVAREALIDAADLPAIAGERWYWSIGQDEEADAAVKGCVATRRPDGGQEALRLRLLRAKSKAAGARTTHRNGDRLDFRRANLLLKDGSEHIHGTRKMRRTGQGQTPTSRFKGVCWKSGEGKWAANIMKDGVAHRLGHFDDEIAAAQAYDEAARELYGELAYQNFPDGVDAWLEKEYAEQDARDEQQQRVAA